MASEHLYYNLFIGLPTIEELLEIQPPTLLQSQQMTITDQDSSEIKEFKQVFTCLLCVYNFPDENRFYIHLLLFHFQVIT
jgi:hypothetical protein